MHIAICDDNVADRKQLERLLKRESDKRAAVSGVLYVDSYGHPESLLRNSMQYDVFFIDICNTEDITGVDVVNSLTALGNISPVILCSSKLNYHDFSLPERALFLDKPVKVAELSAVLDKAQQVKDSAAPVIELREEKGTYYVTEPDILYAVEENRHLRVTLKNGKEVLLNTSSQNFFSQVENYLSFFAPSIHSVVNARHIDHFHFHKITMCDGTVFKAHGQILSYARHVFNDIKSGNL